MSRNHVYDRSGQFGSKFQVGNYTINPRSSSNISHYFELDDHIDSCIKLAGNKSKDLEERGKILIEMINEKINKMIIESVIET